MEIRENRIKTIEQIFSDAKEYSVESDMILPDYYPEVAKILDCSVVFSEEAVTLTTDKISVAGKAKCTLLYLSEDNKLTSFESVSKYTKNIQGSDFQSADYCSVRQSTGNINFRAVSPRKIEVRALSVISVRVFRMSENAIPSDFEDAKIQKHTFKSSLCEITALSDVKLGISDRLPLPVKKDKIKGILSSEAYVFVSEISSIKNKVLLKGTSEIKVVCVDDDGSVYPAVTLSLPFSEIKDVFGAEENSDLSYCVSGTEIDVDLKSASFGEDEAPFTLNCDITLLSCVSGELQAADDVYVPYAKLEADRRELNLPVETTKIREKTEFSFEADNLDIGIAEVSSVSVSDISFRVSESGAGAAASGSCKITCLVKLRDGGYYCISRKNSFEIPLGSVSPDSVIFLQVRNETIGAEIRSNGNVRFYGILCAEGFMIRRIKKTLVGGVNILEQGADDSEKITLYYASKGEKLWDIVKENNAKMECIETLNGISEDVLSEDRLLILN